MANVKVYKARSEVSLCAVLSEGRTMHISFDSLTGGGSTYRTNDEEIQNALEKHHKFNKLFRLAEEIKPESVAKKPAKKAAKASKEDIPSENDSEDAQSAGSEDVETNVDESDEEIQTVKVNDLSEAKEYLAETFDIPRSSLRSKVKIEETAEAHGVRFEGLD